MACHHNDKTTSDLLGKKLAYPLHSKMSLFHLGMDIRLPFYSPKNVPNASLRGKKLLAKISDEGAKANCFLSF